MATDADIDRDVWHGKIPVAFVLASGESSSSPDVQDPLFVRIDANTFVPTLQSRSRLSQCNRPHLPPCLDTAFSASGRISVVMHGEDSKVLQAPPPAKVG